MNRFQNRRLLIVALLLGVLCPTVFAANTVAIGDSMMKNVGRAIRKQFGNKRDDVEVFTSIGSGLARLDLLDWLDKAESVMRENKPKMVFVMMGANDNQTMRTGGGELAFGTQGWDFEYGRRTGKLMDILVDGGAERVIWIGLPCMREKAMDADVRAMERIVVQQADARPRITFFPTASRFSRQGEYVAYIVLENGMPLDIRSDDGIHLNRNGAEHLAKLLCDAFAKSNSEK